mgnify:FL=1|jgi:hypothetical protein
MESRLGIIVTGEYTLRDGDGNIKQTGTMEGLTPEQLEKVIQAMGIVIPEIPKGSD